MRAFGKCLLQRSGQVLLMLTTPTSCLYMESLAGAAKGKVTAAEREAEKKKTKEQEGKNQNTTQETKSSSSDSNSEPASPAQWCCAPNALARLQQRACAPLLRAGPLGRLQQRACARLLRASRATGLRACPSQRGGRVWADCDG